jgi:flagellar basal-body rod modification protein FlgD
MDASSITAMQSASNLAAQNASNSNNASGASASGSTSAGSTDAFSNITSNDFLKMMIAQLQNQDPMNPMDDSQLLQQISQIRDIQASTELTSTLGNLSVGQNLASASALISKNVTALDSTGNNISGIVQSVTMQNGQPLLVINGSNVSLSNIQSILPGDTQSTEDTKADTALAAIQQLLSSTTGIATTDKAAEQSLSDLEQILLYSAQQGLGGSSSAGSTNGTGTTGDTSGATGS